jgi:hypothetical protein
VEVTYSDVDAAGSILLTDTVRAKPKQNPAIDIRALLWRTGVAGRCPVLAARVA